MRYSVFLFVCFLSFGGWSQTGSILVNCVDETTQEPAIVSVEVKQDTVPLKSGITDLKGSIKLTELPLGMVTLHFTYNGVDVGEKYAFVQENQLYQLTVHVGKNYASTHPSGQSFVLSANGDKTSSLRTLDGNLPVMSLTSHSMSNSVVQYSCMMIVASRRSIRMIDGHIGYNYNSEDISDMSFRSPFGYASMVGGVQLNEETNQVHIRGARSDANTYYIDGMRVQNINNIPKSYMGELKIYTGGIPAKYGDVMGGVIAIESPAIKYERYPDYAYEPYVAPIPIVQLPKEIVVPEVVVPEVVFPLRVEERVYNMDRFSPIYENDFNSTIANPNSTFGIDVDRASWTYVQNQFRTGGSISRHAVKLEEMVNAFSYRKVVVPSEELMHVELERSACAWNTESEIVTIHLKAMDLPITTTRKPHNFVFLIDVSGSMSSAQKLPLLKQGLIEFVETLNPDDRVAIVTYADNGGIVLEPTLCSNKKAILGSLSRLRSGGSTNGSGGIEEAYDLAEQNYDPELNNRIILCTDGDFNVGIHNTSELEEYIAKKRGSGIYLTALGYGMGNYRDDILETLADRGDGNHFYINNIEESRKVLVAEIGNLINIARDVKLNVEFNPKMVAEYRLIGYENRMLKPRDFRDDTKDAGEMGYGHEVTAVYEIRLGKAETEKSSFTKSKQSGVNNSDLAIVKLRYKSFEDSSSVERKFVLSKEDQTEKNELLNTVISFGLLMRNSAFKGEMTKEALLEMAKNLEGTNEEVVELKKLIEGYAVL